MKRSEGKKSQTRIFTLSEEKKPDRSTCSSVQGNKDQTSFLLLIQTKSTSTMLFC
jgi:hypothetical protein